MLLLALLWIWWRPIRLVWGRRKQSFLLVKKIPQPFSFLKNQEVKKSDAWQQMSYEAYASCESQVVLYFRSERTKTLCALPCIFEDSCSKRSRFNIGAMTVPPSLKIFHSFQFELEHLSSPSSEKCGQVAPNGFSASCVIPFSCLGVVKPGFGASVIISEQT